MPQNANQHFVPQFYFRRFSEGRNSINLLLKSDGKVVINAAIKHQCSANRFYGSSDLEGIFQGLEGTHSAAMRAISDAAWTGEWSNLTPEILLALWQAVLFQRSRTESAVEREKGVPNALGMPAFGAHLASARGIEDRERMLAAIDKGEITITMKREAAVLQSISIALDATLLISDLGRCVLRNQTATPFIFSDSPVVFYNTLLRKVTSRGVLGLQSPGLQIFLPLDARTQLMLYDENAYNIPHDTCVDVIDVAERSDVAQLNALQLHNSLHSVYFGDPSAQEYVGNLWHRASQEPATSGHGDQESA